MSPALRRMQPRWLRFAAVYIGLLGAGSVVAQPPAPKSTLPQCVDAASDLASILSIQKSNAKTPNKYAGYRKLLATDTPLQLATRLVYAETLAANCPAQNDRVADLITAVIGNRIRIRQGDAASVVFQRDQFSSSLNIYPESRYREFLCPTDEKLWKAVSARMHANLDASTANADIPDDAVNYYLYRHSERFTAPDWKLDEAKVGGDQLRNCIRVFRNPHWK